MQYNIKTYSNLRMEKFDFVVQDGSSNIFRADEVSFEDVVSWLSKIVPAQFLIVTVHVNNNI